MTSEPATPPAPPVVDQDTADALTQVLFDPDDFGAVHAPWRQLIATPEFTYRTGLTEQERIELAYRRKSMVDQRLAHPLALATDPVRLAGLHEWIAPADPTCASVLSIHHSLYLGSLAEADPNPQRPLAEEHRTGVFMVTEVGCGNDAAELSTCATWNPEDETFELSTPGYLAQKFMPNTSPIAGAKIGVVAARLHAYGRDRGVMLFRVPLTSDDGQPLPGIRIRQMPERAGAPMDHCITAFDNVKLPAHALLEGDHGRLRDGVFTSNLSNPRAQLLAAIHRVTPGRLAMTAAAIGCARAALAIAVRYSHYRYISGRPAPVPIAAHRTHAAPLISHLATTYAATLLHRRNVHAYAATDEDRQHTERNISLAKAWVTWAARDAVTEARDRCGARGIFPHNGIAGLAAALDSTVTAEGDNVPILVKAASELLFDHEPPRAAAPVDSLSALADLRHLLAVAEAIAATRARDRFRTYDQTRHQGLERWNEASLPATKAATLHTIGQAADAFLAVVDQCQDPKAGALLTALARLFLLQQIQPHTGPLQAYGHLTAHAERSLPDLIEDSIAALTPHMLTLVAAFDLDGYLASIPIAHATYALADDDPNAHWHHHPHTPQHSDAAPWALAALRVTDAAAASSPHASSRGPSAS